MNTKHVISIIMPVYNESYTIDVILKRVNQVRWPLGCEYELICVDDASNDGTAEWLKNYKHANVRMLFKDVNEGKAAAVRSGLEIATGDIFTIQDADLEYNPDDLPRLIQPILDGYADVVLGSRFMGGQGTHRVLNYWHYLANKVLTVFSNMLTNLYLSDVQTGYKAFTRQSFEGIDIESRRFELEIELAAKFARRKLRIYELPVSYFGRSYQQKKKITWIDGIVAVFSIIRFNWFIRD